MKQILLALLLIFLFWATYSQVESINHQLIPNSVDSIQLSICEWNSKEMLIPSQDMKYETEIERVVLSDNDKEVLITKLRDPNSYDETRALPYHYNMVFDLFHKGTNTIRIEISTMTGNIDIENKLKDLHFRNNCSEQLNIVLMELLTKYDLKNLIDEIDLEGITTDNKE